MELISGSWNPASISALAAIFGSLAGAFGSTATAWIAQRHQDRRDLLAKKIFHREQLYSDFINESTKIMVDAAQHTFQDPGRLIPAYALLSRIRLSSSMNVVESAERVLKTILDIYSEPNLTPDEIKSKAAKGDYPLRDFSNICRRDLESLWTGLHPRIRQAPRMSHARSGTVLKSWSKASAGFRKGACLTESGKQGA